MDHEVQSIIRFDESWAQDSVFQSNISNLISINISNIIKTSYEFRGGRRWVVYWNIEVSGQYYVRGFALDLKYECFQFIKENSERALLWRTIYADESGSFIICFD